MQSTAKLERMSDTVVDLQLGIDEALVLFETLAEFQNQPSVAVPSSAERLALIRLHGVLEKSLVEPFRPDYQQVLEAARARLRAQFGRRLGEDLA